MSIYTDLPKPVRAGIVIDPDRGKSQRVIVRQFNPDTLERSLAPQSSGAEQGDRTEALRLKGPAIETWKFTAELDASDQPDLPSEFGIHPQLATLEMLVNPTSGQLKTNQALATLEITPVETPLTFFVWGARRVTPGAAHRAHHHRGGVRRRPQPVSRDGRDRAAGAAVNDLPTGHRGSGLYLAYLSQKEQFAGSAPKGRLETLGLRNL